MSKTYQGGYQDGKRAGKTEREEKLIQAALEYEDACDLYEEKFERRLRRAAAAVRKEREKK